MTTRAFLRTGQTTLLILCLALAVSCTKPGETVAVEPAPESQVQEQSSAMSERPAPDYDLLRHKITYSQASLAEVRQAMTAGEKHMLTNIVHALYSMRWLRGVRHLLDDAWQLNMQNYTEFSWELLSEAPVRIALASTLNRILIKDTQQYLEYIRAHKSDEDEFNRAQVVIALGFNGALEDLAYLKSMADGDNHYVAQSAITALAIMGGTQARDVLIELARKHEDTPRGDLMLELLLNTFKWQPPENKGNSA